MTTTATAIDPADFYQRGDGIYWGGRQIPQAQNLFSSPEGASFDVLNRPVDGKNGNWRVYVNIGHWKETFSVPFSGGRGYTFETVKELEDFLFNKRTLYTRLVLE